MLRKLASFLVALFLVATTGCAKPAGEATVLTGDAAVVALRAAPDTAAAAGSGRFEMTVAVDTAEGVFDIVATGGFTGDQMTMEMDLGSVLAQAAAASGDTVPEGFEEPMLMVVDGTTTYMRNPMLQALTGGTGWLSLSTEDLGLAGGSLGFGAGGDDPSRLLETLRGVADDVEVVGTDEVRGAAVTHLRATIDLAKALEQAPAEQRGMLEAQLEGLDESLSGIPVEVWIDGDGLARRMVMVTDAAVFAPAAMAEGSVTLTIEFFDYGEPIFIEIPPAEDTEPLGEVLGGIGHVEAPR